PAGRVEAQHARVLDLVAEGGADDGQLLAHVLGGAAPVGVQVEHHDDQRTALVRARVELVDARHRVDGLLDLAGDLGLDDGGRGARVVDLHHQGGQVDVGERSEEHT